MMTVGMTTSCLLSSFLTSVTRTLVLLDEAVHLYKINHAVSQNNYDKLAMFNDTMQGRAEHLGIWVEHKILEDPRRGLFNDQAWARRTAKAVIAKVGKTSGPVIQLETLTQEEILLQQQLMFMQHFDDRKAVTTREFKEFLQEIVNRLGAEALLTPGEIVRDFISVLNILQQNPETFSELIHGSIRLLLHLKTPMWMETAKLLSLQYEGSFLQASAVYSRIHLHSWLD